MFNESLSGTTVAKHAVPGSSKGIDGSGVADRNVTRCERITHSVQVVQINIHAQLQHENLRICGLVASRDELLSARQC